MDRNTLIGLLLIGAILLTFTWMNKDEESAQNEPTKTEHTSATVADSTQNIDSTAVISANPIPNDSILIAGLADSLKMDSVFVATYLDSIHASFVAAPVVQDLESEFGIFAPSAVTQETQLVTLENDKLIVTISSLGGELVDVKLKEYQSYADYHASPDSINPLQLINESNSNFGLSLVNSDVPFLTNQLYFVPQTEQSHFVIGTGDSTSVSFRLLTNDATKYIEFRYSLKGGSYDVGFEIEYVNLKNKVDIDYDNAFLNWSVLGLSTEKLVSDERTIATTMYRYYNQTRDYLSERSTSEEELTSSVNWVAFKHKFFTSAIVSSDGTGFRTGSKVSQEQKESDEYTLAYNAKLKLAASNLIKTEFYFGPNEYNALASHDNGMEEIINLGWGIFGWVNIYFIQPVYDLLRSWGLAFGLIIFLVTLVVKIVITPLTYKNYISSAKMKVLKPEIERINEKFAGQDQMLKRQQETQALYRMSGVNPLAGCIPMLIQMPILLAVFRFFPSSIHLRHASFLWADDLSSFDAIASWTGDIPFLTWAYGNHISLFTLLMAASTLIYTIMNSGSMAQPSQPGMPNMKVIMSIFPFLMIFFFNSFSAGLSYYYLCGNLFNIGIMYGIKKFFIDEDKIRLKIEENKKKPVKKNKFMQRLEEVQKQQAKQKKK